MKGVYGDDVLSYDIVSHWHLHLKCGRTPMDTAPIPERHSAIDEDSIHKVEAVILEDHRITIRQLAQEVKVSVGSVKNIIHNHLQMRKVSAKWIPRMLTPFQKQERANCSRLFWQRARRKMGSSL
ncbi:protein GVQW3-like [Octopus bimaculoides]|uniref:protein GVQW3-like n=1 Tax=Octopus bimaculoides TaxID=37653 RepID=UPI00071CB5BA|nr:protein GVQW3-like [Octopus bimaculoides]|eukprot:XP_014782081.1 PREDICTED: putative uncharacterized protein FLJ37770 [Octopus bimaculoides]